MKSETDSIAKGGEKLQKVLWIGLAIPGIWTIYDLLLSRTGLGFFTFMFLTIGITLGSSMSNGSPSAHRLWIIGGFSLTAILALVVSFAKADGASNWIYFLASAIFVFAITIFSIADKDLKAYIADQHVKNKVPMQNSEMEQLIEEIGRD